MMYIHSNNDTDERIDVSKVANMSTMGAFKHYTRTARLEQSTRHNWS